MFSTLNHNEMTTKLILSLNIHTYIHVLKVVRTSKILCWKMKMKTPREKIKKSVQRTLGFRFIHEKFLKSLGRISSKMFYTLN